MKIHLTDPYVSYRVSTARQVPLRFQTMAEQIVTNLVKAQVIDLEVNPTEWCAPAFFVPKGDGLRVRLVTDYKKLNRYVQRPVHTFPSVKEIVQAVPVGKFFLQKCSPFMAISNLLWMNHRLKSRRFCFLPADIAIFEPPWAFFRPLMNCAATRTGQWDVSTHSIVRSKTQKQQVDPPD